MSRAKIGHEFCPMPRRWHAGWANHDSAHARGVRNALFELADGAPIPVHGVDWLESLCKQMQFHGRERPNVRKALKAFAADQLIAWDGSGLVLGCFLPGAELLRPVADRSRYVVVPSSTGERVVTDRSANERPLNIPPDSTPRNDSDRVSQTDRRDRQTEETETGACEARPVARVKPAQAPAIPTGPLRVWKLYAELLGLDPLQLGSPRWEACKVIEAAATAEAAGATSGPAFDAALRRLMSAWRADSWVQAENPSLAHLAGNLAKYAPGVKAAAPRLDARTQREQLEELRDRVKQAHIRVNRCDSAPWFDKESPHFPARERDAAAELAAANAALREAQAACKMQVAS